MNTPPLLNRREVLRNSALGFGSLALADLLQGESSLLSSPQLPAKAKRVIFLFQSGGPSQLDLYDPKPLLNKKHGEQLPDKVRGGQRLSTCLLYTSPSPRDYAASRMPSSA